MLTREFEDVVDDKILEAVRNATQTEAAAATNVQGTNVAAAPATETTISKVAKEEPQTAVV